MTGDEGDDFYSNDKDINVFFDDDVYFTFNHQTDSSIAAIQTLDDITDPVNDQYFEKLAREKLADLTDE
jgi:hypothetical protein